MAYVPQVREREGSTDPSADDGPALLNPSTEPLSLWSFELSLANASLDALESASRSVGPVWLDRLFDRSPETAEAVVLSTCHRVEILLLLRRTAELEAWRGALPSAGSAWTVREGPEAAEHLFRVAAGLESLARGEAEVRHQVESAGPRVKSRHARPFLRTLLEGAVNATRSAASVAATPPSVASIGVARLRALLSAQVPRVLVVGSGTVGREVVDALGTAAEVTIAYHARPPTAEYLATSRAVAVPMSELRAEITRADAVVTAAKFGGRGLRTDDLPRDRPLVVLDLGQPRNVEPSVRNLPNVRLIDLEELYRLERDAAPGGPVDEAVAGAANVAYQALERELWEPYLAAWRRAAESIRLEELARARRFFGELSPSQEVAVERLTRRLVSRLLLAPTERLRGLGAQPDGERMRRLALELLGPPPAGP